MKQVIDLVDSVEYATSNCFGHQLSSVLDQFSNVRRVPLASIHQQQRPDLIVSRLRQRTLLRECNSIGKWARDTPMVIFDQDPWQAYMDDSPYRGAYDVIAENINVKFFALTTKWWADFVNDKGHPSKFVRMWVLQEYCDVGRPFEERIAAGFIGSLHPRRKELVDICKKAGVDVNVIKGNSLPYVPFLKEMSRLGIFVHNEDMPIYVDGKELNFNTGMWVKDVEAISRGCFSIRSKADGWDTYLSGLETAVLYDNIRDVPDLIRAIQVMDPEERRNAALRSVQAVQKANVWHETALSLIS